MNRIARSSFAFALSAFCLVGCSIDVTGRAIPMFDAQVFDAQGDAPMDMSRPDAGIDLGRDMAEPPVDEGVDLNDIDLGPDFDAGTDAGIDAGEDDMGTDLGVDMSMPPVDLGTDEGVDLGPPPCSDSLSPTCYDADTLMLCSGGVPSYTSCSLGCATLPEPQCRKILPSNTGPLVAVDDSPAELNTASTPGQPYWYIDTETGQILAVDMAGTTSTEIRAANVTGLDHGIRFTHRPGAGDGADLGVFVVHSLVVAEGTALVPRGPRALVLLAATTVEIRGGIYANANVAPTLVGPGPGGGAGGMLEANGEGSGAGRGGIRATLGNDDSGGGGASFGTLGGDGGGTVLLPGGTNGELYGASDLIPLEAGSGGGGGGDNDGGAGGAGGGAVQISAGDSITVTATGFIDVSGAGGFGGVAMSTTTDSGGGGGGGSGGAILLEAANVLIAGALAANGGAGGQGATCATCVGANGANGGYLVEPAAGVASAGIGGGGGNGSDASGAAQDGAVQENSGGGGGGAGRIRINTRSGSFTIASDVTPNLASGATSVGMVGATP